MSEQMMLVPRELLESLLNDPHLPPRYYCRIKSALSSTAAQAVDEDAERTAFEAWHTKQYFPEVWDGRLNLLPGYFDRYERPTYERCVGTVPSGEYVREEHRKDFALWKARAALAAPVQSEQSDLALQALATCRERRVRDVDGDYFTRQSFDSDKVRAALDAVAQLNAQPEPKP